MRKIVFALMCIISLGMHSQELPEIVPASPEAASLGKYGDIPVSMYTGVPNISVPLTTLEGNSLSVPISLNYHASGIRVNEIASRVGLGWSLSSLGSITRSYRGLPDDSADGFINTDYSVPDLLSGTNLQTITRLADVYGHIDFESDVYNYNILGEHGKFFFTQQGDIITFPKSDIEFIPVMNSSKKIIGWEIIGTNGTIYYMGTSKDGTKSANDRSTVFGTNGSSIPQASTPLTNYITTWHIMDIETHDGRMTSFDYEYSAISFWNITSQSREIATNNGSSGNQERKSYTNNQDAVHRVTQITNDKGSVLFNYDLAREDLKGDFALTSVTLVDASNNTIEAYQLEYDYFDAIQLHNDHLGDLDQRRKRLYLKNVKQVSENQTDKTHTFTYNTQYTLPDRFSFAQDFWGYYNGRNNTRLYPQIQWNVNGVLSTIPGGDRKVYEPYAKACVLTKIQYPTGGYTEFEFESNRISNQGFFGLTNMVNTSLGGATTANSNSSEFVENITINDPSPYVGGISWTVNMDTCANPNGLDCPYAELYIIKNNQEQLLSRSNGQSLTKGIVFDPSTPLQLRIKLYNYTGTLSERKDITVLITGLQLDATDQNAIAAGGLRVSQITNKDTDGTKILQKNYEYTYFDDANTSSGASLNPPTFVYKNIPFCNNFNVPDGISDILKSNSIFPLTNGSSYTAGYTEVTELIDNGNQGKNEFTYLFTYDGNGYQSNIYQSGAPADIKLNTPLHDFSHRRGLLLDKKVYARNKNATSYRLLEQTENKYTKFGQLISDDNVVIEYSVCHGGFNIYQNLSERYHLERQITKNFFDPHEITITKNYIYDTGYSGRTFPTGNTTKNSDNITTEVMNFFPDDISSTSSLEGGNLSSEAYNTISLMKKNGSKKRVGIPIQTITTTNTRKTILRTNFKNWGDGILLPESVQTAKGSDNVEPRIQYHDYDDYGNPLEISKADGPNIIYIWGYNDQYPIAKIENASYTNMLTATRNLINQIKSASNDEDTDTEEDALRTMFDTLREDGYFVQTPMITSYTYDPLIGVTSMTDPRGYTMYYEYDNLNRLTKVKDQDGNILSENEYHYQNN